MSESQRIQGDRVYCHVCSHEWDREEGGLQCPQCDSEFVEIVEANTRPESPPIVLPSPRTSQPTSPNPFLNHNPWAPDPEEDDITSFEFNHGGGRGTVSFTSRTYTFGGGGTANMTMSRDLAASELTQNFESMLGNILGFNPRTRPTMMGGFMRMDSSTFGQPRGQGQGQGQSQGAPPDLFSMLFPNPGQPRDPNRPTSAFELLGAMLNPANARRGDMVFSQEAFDQIMTQLMEQNQTSSAPGPASESAIAALKKKPVDEKMLGNDGKAECSICMDGVEVGQEVTVLPCNHWFHGECVASWLREHDTCPHCRAPITSPEENNRDNNRPRSSRRRLSRRSSSVASPLSPIREGSHRNAPIPDSPSGLRDARSRYYASVRTSDALADRPVSERRSSDRSQRSADSGGGGGGGVASWIRSRFTSSGQQ